MGLRFRRSIRLLPGVRLNLSKSGIGLSAGVPGARLTLGADGRVRRTVGLPGTGLSWVEESGSRRRRAPRAGRDAGRAPDRDTGAKPDRGGDGDRGRIPAGRADRDADRVPGPPADRGGHLDPGRARLLEALTARDWDAAARVGDEHPQLALAARTVAGLGRLAAGQPARARPLLAAVIADGRDPAADGFVRDHVAPAGEWTITVSPGATAKLPVGRDLVGLALAELCQADGDLDAAVEVLDTLSPTTLAAASLAELLVAQGRWGDVVELTEALEARDDVTCWLLTCRGVALRALGMPGPAAEALTTALRRRSLDPTVRCRALLERASAWTDLGQRAKARRDLDRIVAVDADFPGVEALRARLDAGGAQTG
jgi:hypothetical protein